MGIPEKLRLSRALQEDSVRLAIQGRKPRQGRILWTAEQELHLTRASHRRKEKQWLVHEESRVRKNEVKYTF